MGEREGRERERARDRQTDRQTENAHSNSKTLILKDSSIRSIWTRLTASLERECVKERGGWKRERETQRQRGREKWERERWCQE